jgi:hypothetical protein
MSIIYGIPSKCQTIGDILNFKPPELQIVPGTTEILSLPLHPRNTEQVLFWENFDQEIKSQNIEKWSEIKLEMPIDFQGMPLHLVTSERYIYYLPRLSM